MSPTSARTARLTTTHSPLRNRVCRQPIFTEIPPHHPWAVPQQLRVSAPQVNILKQIRAWILRACGTLRLDCVCRRSTSRRLPDARNLASHSRNPLSVIGWLHGFRPGIHYLPLAARNPPAVHRQGSCQVPEMAALPCGNGSPQPRPACLRQENGPNY